MDYEQIQAPFQDNAVDNIGHEDGAIDILPRISMRIPDQDMIKNLNDRIENSVNYWNDTQGYNLKYARAQSERMVIGKQIDISKLYRYQIPYVDNEVHVAIDTIISYVTAQSPRPEVYPAQSGEKSKIIARDVEKAMMAYNDTNELSTVFEQALYGVLVKRLGVIKLWYDPDADEIKCKSINPDWIIVDKNAKMGDNPQFICELHKDTLEEVVRLFPKKQKEIFELMKIKQGTPNQMTQEVVWREVHATVYDNNKETEVIFCFMKNVMLSKVKDPNWLYDQDGGKLKNFLDAPVKPYIPLNYLNSGIHWVDETTPVEQAYSMQDVLNKRGRQIMENADTANGFLALSDEAITMDDAENLTGDPNQKFVIKTGGRPIEEFIMQVPPHMLPDFVLEDKVDIRTTLHSLMGTPSQLSGTNEGSENKDNTLGEAIMIKNQASGRQDRLARAVERTARQVFNYWLQLARVWYTGKHWSIYNGGDGDFDHVVLTRHMIDPGMQVHVRSGTTLPFDKARQEAIAMNLAKMGLISPLDLYKDLHMDNPQQRYDNWFKFKSNPQQLARDVENKEQDGQAYMEFVEIMNGVKTVKPYDEANEEHILTHRKQMITDEFLKASAQKQKLLMDIVEEELKSLELRQQLDEMSAPPEEPPAQAQNPGMGQPTPGMPMPQSQPMMGQPMPPGMPPQGMPPQMPGAMPPPMQQPMPVPSIAGVMGGIPQPTAVPNNNLANPMQMNVV